MERPKDESIGFGMLRRRAEEALRGQPVELGDLSSKEIQYLLHELQVHQAELEIQNEELRRVQLDLEVSRDRYTKLYDFAPAGYCTISHKDKILEANQTLAELLEVECKQIIQEKFSRFVAREDQDKYYFHRRLTFERGLRQASEIRMIKAGGERIDVRLESKMSEAEADQMIVMISDISQLRKVQHLLLKQREEERQQIAHDLHDGPVQALTGVTFSLRSLLMGGLPPEAAEQLEAIQATLQEQIHELRMYSGDLRPPTLSRFGLEQTVRAHAEEFQERHPEIHLEIDIGINHVFLSQDIRVALYRIYQEALMNLLKHAQASQARVIIRKNHGDIHLEVQDNGRGFVLPDQLTDFAKRGHLGLIGMEERANALNGYLSVISQPGEGTTIRVSIPRSGTSDTEVQPEGSLPGG